MPVNIDIFDSANLKYDNTLSGLAANDVQAAIDELDAQVGGTNLSNAQFPDWAGFVNEGSTAINAGGTTNINFSTSNKHALTGSGSTTIGTFTFPQENAHYWITIPSAITIAGVSATGKQEYGTNDLTAGKAHVMAIYWDGTTAHWQTSEEP